MHSLGDAPTDLLFGLIALHNDLIAPATAFAALRARDGKSTMGEILVAAGDFTARQKDLVESLASECVRRNGGDVRRSVAALIQAKPAPERLAAMGDDELTATLQSFGSTVVRESGCDAESATVSQPDASRFRVLRPHAKGGIGEIFVALDAELNREVALKRIQDRRADDPGSRARFLMEAEVTGGLEHPGIVPVYALGRDPGGRPYYAMRFIRGDSLKEAVERFHSGNAEPPERAVSTARVTDPGSRSLELRKLLRRFTDVCNAIDYAHSRGVLHRDIKPGNIIVGKHGETLVVDWGLAKATGRVEPGTTSDERAFVPSSASGSAETLPGSVLGTPAYMSPEQAAGDFDRLGPASDVYSLGATLYCLLTGVTPFQGSTDEMLRAVQDGVFAAPRAVDPALDPALEAICLKAMARDPQTRYSSCRALAEDLERWAADEPVSAWREPLVRRARRWARRNRTKVAAAVVSLAASVVGLGAVSAVQTRANVKLTQSLERETQANTELGRSRAAVQARYDLAVDAIKTFHTGVSEDFLLKQDQFKELRDRLLNSASDFYGRLGALLGTESDRVSRGALAQANFEVADLTANVGKTSDAIAAHRRVLAAREALAGEPGADVKAQADVGRSLTAIATLLEGTGKTEEAVKTYREAEGLLATLSSRHPGGAAAPAALADCRTRLGWLLHATGKADESLTMLRLARADQTALSEADGSNPTTRRDLASTIFNIGAVLSETGKPSEAEAEYHSAIQLQQKLADDFPTLAGARSQLAHSRNNLGNLLARIGRPADAESEFRKALALYKTLTDENPAVNEFRSLRAQSHGGLAILMSNAGRAADAEAEFRKALVLRQKLADDNPAVTGFRAGLAESHNNLGIQLWRTGNLAAAEAEYRLAQAIYQKLAELHPAVTGFRGYLANSRNALGALLSQAGRTTEAKGELRAAIVLYQKLSRDNPKVTDFRDRLAQTHNNLAILLANTGKSRAAEAEYRAAIALLQRLAGDNPTVTQFRSYLAENHIGLGSMLTGRDRPSEAVDSCQQALSLIQALAEAHPEDKSYPGVIAATWTKLSAARLAMGHTRLARDAADRALTLYKPLVADDNGSMELRGWLGEAMLRSGQARLAEGDVSEAARELRAALDVFQAMPPREPEFAFLEACCHAVLASLAGKTGSGVSASVGSAEAEAAMQGLRGVASGGYRDPERYRNERALDSLRGRPDFQALVLDLAMPADPIED